MQFRIFNNKIILRIDKGEEIIESIKELCIKKNINLGSISGIGAVNYVEAGLFNVNKKQYHTNIFEGEFEIVSLNGNITKQNDKPYLHFHICISDIEGKSFGGHLNKAIVSATSEFVIDIIENCELSRTFNDSIGLNIIDFS